MVIQSQNSLIVHHQEKNEKWENLFIKKEFTFVDLFCGMGVFHEAIAKTFPKFDCKWAVDSSEKKRECINCYFLYFPKKDFYVEK